MVRWPQRWGVIDLWEPCRQSSLEQPNLTPEWATLLLFALP